MVGQRMVRRIVTGGALCKAHRVHATKDGDVLGVRIGEGRRFEPGGGGGEQWRSEWRSGVGGLR